MYRNSIDYRDERVFASLALCVCFVKRAGGHAQVQALQFPEVESNKSLVPYDVSSTGISRYGKYAQLARTYR